VTPDVWTAKDIQMLLVQCGALGLLFLVLLMVGYIIFNFGNRFLDEIKSLHGAFTFLASVIVDHKARHGDTTPPERLAIKDPNKRG